jgi:hypothetical protein
MESDEKAKFKDEKRPASQAVDHITGAHQHLTGLRDQGGVLGEHPELRDAITKLEMALSILTIKTGGML